MEKGCRIPQPPTLLWTKYAAQKILTHKPVQINLTSKVLGESYQTKSPKWAEAYWWRHWILTMRGIKQTFLEPFLSFLSMLILKASNAKQHSAFKAAWQHTIRKLVVSQLGEIMFSAVDRSVFAEFIAGVEHTIAEKVGKNTTYCKISQFHIWGHGKDEMSQTAVVPHKVKISREASSTYRSNLMV